MGENYYKVTEHAAIMADSVEWNSEGARRRNQQPAFVRSSILADGLILATDGNTKMYLVEPSPAGFKPLASAVILEAGDNWAPLALTDGRQTACRRQKELKVFQVAQ